LRRRVGGEKSGLLNWQYLGKWRRLSASELHLGGIRSSTCFYKGEKEELGLHHPGRVSLFFLLPQIIRTLQRILASWV
jgi:hypothetical protein